jgi:peptide/nickel transport system substrate-binding protein
MTFHDGTPVTADDVKFTFDYIMKWNFPSYNPAIKPIDSVEKIGPLTVRFKLKEPFAAFLNYALCTVPIIPQHIWEDVPEKLGIESPEEWTDWEELCVGSGPFKFEYWRRGEELKMARHQGHFTNPKIEGILRVAFGDMQSLIMAFEKKEVDMIGWTISPVQADMLSKHEHVTIVNVPNNGIMPIHYNCRVKPFSDVAFRRALAYAVPKERIAKEFYEGYAIAADSMMGPMVKYWHNPNVEKIRFDMDKARQILKEAGYEWDKDGKLYYPPTQ